MIEIRAQDGPWHNGINILISERQPSGKLGTVRTLTMEEYDTDAFVEPTAVLTKTAAQVLMDDLWSAGLRPSEGSGSAGSLRATEKHLNDLRKIVNKTLGVDL